MSRQDLLGLNRTQLAALLENLIDRPFRVDQLYRALHHRKVRDFDSVTEFGKALRSKLAERFMVGRPRVSAVDRSADGTEKVLFELQDGVTIEAVDIPEGDRRTLCISSQAGCALACKFCVTGYWGAGRDLTSGEIVGQVFALEEGRDENPPRSSNLVFMGMGEPLLNLDSVKDSLEILCESRSWRRVTVSTAGIVPGIRAMAAWPRRPNLAISLHAPDDERRSRLMPINRTYPLSELIGALRDYPLESGRRLTFEYLLVHGFNESQRDAVAIAKLISGIPAKVNLIPMNPDSVLDPDLKPPSLEHSEAFRESLQRLGVTATVRRPRGDDAAAACGQLRAPGRSPRGFPGVRADQSVDLQINATLRPELPPSRR